MVLKNNCKFIYLAIIINLFIFKLINARVAISLKVNFLKGILIESNLNNESESIIIRPHIITNDNCNRIIIADGALLEIKVFNKNGVFLNSFGGIGNESGKFQHITAMTVNNNNDVILIDYLNKKFVVYTIHGILKSEFKYPISNLPIPRGIRCRSDGSYIILGIGDRCKYIFHHFSKNFKYIKSFGKLPIINNKSTDFEYRYSSIEPGQFICLPNNKIIYAPGLYNGRLYIFNKDSISRILTIKKYKNYPYEYKYFTEPQIGVKRPQKYTTSMTSSNGTYWCNRNIKSLGFCISNNNLICHLVEYREENNINYLIEEYSINSDKIFIKHLNLTSKNFNNWLNGKNKWYLYKYINYIPIIQEYFLFK